MSYGSYYASSPNYYRNPVPYTSGDYGAPVPGWGVNPQVAGPARLGIGAITLQQGRPLSYTIGPQQQSYTDQSSEPVASEPLPWWIWPVLAAAAVGGAGYYATKRGWI